VGGRDGAPVIILGMHRSGTSLVARILSRLGLFVGAHIDGHHESIFFRARNQMLLERCGGSWDRPLPIQALLDQPDLRDAAVRQLRSSVRSAAFLQHLGPRRYLRRLRGRAIGPWGWKDPRTVLTLPLWSEVFPEAALLMVRRNGVDVAASLTTRARARSEALGAGVFSRPAAPTRRILNLVRPVERTPSESISLRCLDLDESFGLWAEYVTEAERRYDEHPGKRVVVRFEDLLEEPAGVLRELAAFSGLDPSEAAIEHAATTIDPTRRYSFLEDEELRGLYSRVRQDSWMTKLGYGDVSSL